MKPHDEDPIDRPPADFEADSGSADESDSWDRMAEQWKSLGRRLRDTYRQSADESGPTDDEIKAAFRTLGGAWDRLTEALGTAVRDDRVRENVKRAATGFFEAVGSAFSELGSELRKPRTESDDSGDRTDSDR